MTRVVVHGEHHAVTGVGQHAADPVLVHVQGLQVRVEEEPGRLQVHRRLPSALVTQPPIRIDETPEAGTLEVEPIKRHERSNDFPERRLTRLGHPSRPPTVNYNLRLREDNFPASGISFRINSYKVAPRTSGVKLFRRGSLRFDEIVPGFEGRSMLLDELSLLFRSDTSGRRRVEVCNCRLFDEMSVSKESANTFRLFFSGSSKMSDAHRCLL